MENILQIADLTKRYPDFYLSSFANNTAKNSSGDILAIPPEQRDNNGGGSPYVP